MDQNFQGDLTDILRASGSTSNNNNSDFQEPLGLSVEPKPNNNNSSWQFTSSSDHHHHHHHHHDHMMSNFPPSLMEEEDHQTLLVPGDIFGDPFSHARDPLHHHINIPGPGFFDAAEPGFFTSPPPPPPQPSQQASVDHDVKINPNCNIFSRMLQINPSGGSSAATKAEVSSPRGLIGKPGDALIGASIGGAPAGGGMQISSPRNPSSGIKRRKSQAKKVVCIPAPAAANSRASGEVVPSDLWAWRKYGQKPIKGSPYPRGYYRCSSSKGCSARKQVERSRTDPNMLVITYTSEHNHPWPTQRNALAGSTRSQPAKSNNNANSNNNNNAISSKNFPIGSSDQLQKNITSPKEEQPKPETNNNNNNNITTTSTTSASVKEENTEKNNDIEKRLESLDDSAFSGSTGHEVGLGYRPGLMSNVNDHDFFAELGEIEANNPMSLLFSQGFSSSTDHQNQHKELVAGNNNDTKALLDHTFSLFDWSEGNNNNIINNKPQ